MHPASPNRQHTITAASSTAKDQHTHFEPLADQPEITVAPANTKNWFLRLEPLSGHRIITLLNRNQ